MIRHPRLRVYVMHYGSPLVDEMIALMHAHPQVYVDVAGNNWQYPREHFYRQLETFSQARTEILGTTTHELAPTLIMVDQVNELTGQRTPGAEGRDLPPRPVHLTFVVEQRDGSCLITYHRAGDLHRHPKWTPPADVPTRASSRPREKEETMERISLTILVAVSFVACAHGSGQGSGDESRDYRLYSLKEVDQRPELLECSSYIPPPGRGAGGLRIAYVSVSFSLSPSGQVISPMVTNAPRGVPGIRSAALSAARSCRYTPARIDGRSVGVQGLGRTFAFEV